MTGDEEFFHQSLDLRPTDAAARFLLAEFHAERGDPQGDGYRGLAEAAVLPQDYPGTKTWDWNDDLHLDNLPGSIPHAIYLHLRGGRLSIHASYREYPTRRAAEEAFCAALARFLRGDPVPLAESP